MDVQPYSQPELAHTRFKAHIGFTVDIKQMIQDGYHPMPRCSGVGIRYQDSTTVVKPNGIVYLLGLWSDVPKHYIDNVLPIVYKYRLERNSVATCLTLVHAVYIGCLGYPLAEDILHKMELGNGSVRTYFNKNGSVVIMGPRLGLDAIWPTVVEIGKSYQVQQ